MNRVAVLASSLLLLLHLTPAKVFLVQTLTEMPEMENKHENKNGQNYRSSFIEFFNSLDIKIGGVKIGL